ncbi:MAG TPA: DegV family protein [Clostridiales bacterium]|nr:DegV family protein [Clostridiales bacterium]
MENKIIVDSSIDFNDDITEEIDRVPFKILIDNDEIADVNLNTEELISKMKSSKKHIKTACPSPDEYMNLFSKDGASFVVTISSALSGSYNSAMLAKNMFLEKIPEGLVHIFDTKSAASGSTLVALKIKQLIEENLNFSEIIEATNKYISKLKTLFILDSLDNLVKNGRISGVKAKVASLLHIVPIMGDNGNGEIELVEQVRGNKKAFNRLIEIIGEFNIDFENTILGITHSNAMEKAENLKKELLSRYKFKDVLIFKAGGLSTVYADDGGIVVAF